MIQSQGYCMQSEENTNGDFACIPFYNGAHIFVNFFLNCPYSAKDKVVFYNHH